MDDLNNLAQTFQTLLKTDTWQTKEARAILRAGRALAREQGRPGSFDRLLFEPRPLPPVVA